MVLHMDPVGDVGENAWLELPDDDCSAGFMYISDIVTYTLCIGSLEPLSRTELPKASALSN